MLNDLMCQQEQQQKQDRTPKKEKSGVAPPPSSPTAFCPFSFPSQTMNLFTMPGFTNFSPFPPGRRLGNCEMWWSLLVMQTNLLRTSSTLNQEEGQNINVFNKYINLCFAFQVLDKLLQAGFFTFFPLKKSFCSPLPGCFIIIIRP